jgi:hypothetical protein
MPTVPEPRTFTYSQGVDLDAYIPSITGPIPVLIFFHSGGMVAGSKRDILFPTWLVGGLSELSVHRTFESLMRHECREMLGERHYGNFR